MNFVSEKTLYSHDGIAHYELVIKPIYVSGKLTGHYSIEQKKKITVYGLLDDESEKINFLYNI